MERPQKWESSGYSNLNMTLSHIDLPINFSYREKLKELYEYLDAHPNLTYVGCPTGIRKNFTTRSVNY